MNPVFSVFIATSLDGFIARPDGSIDWLLEANRQVPEGEDCGYAEFMASVDALLMGRKTFDTVLGFEAWPYVGKRVYVLSHTLTEVPASLRESVALIHGEPHEVAAQLAERGHRRIYLDGGQTIQGFLAAGAVQELTITQVPVLIGAGRPLFGALPQDVHPQHVSTRAYPFGFVQTKYTLPSAG